MLLTREEEELDAQFASLEETLQEVAEEWSQLGQELESNQSLLSSVKTHTEHVRAMLAAAGSIDQQVRNALTELLIIGQVQQFLLE